MTPDYSYQRELIQKVLTLFREGKREVVLAAGCSSGKTRMSIQISEIILRDMPSYRIMVLAHGQSILRSQYYNELKEYGPSFPYGIIDSRNDSLGPGVTVGIPQSIGDHVNDADVIICDEAHQFYLAAMVQSIVKRCRPKMVLLLTGSPSKFIAKNYDIVPFSVSELLEHGVISDPRVSLLRSTYEYGKDDINDDHEISTAYKLRKKNTEETLELIKGRIKGKTLIACRHNEHARDVFNHLSSEYDCLLSTSNNDPDSENIVSFINGRGQILIVVYRSILGFSLNELETVIDISGSHNPDRIFQLMSRTIRKSDKQKYFYKVTTDLLSEYTFCVMSLVVALTQPEVYTTYAGNINNVTFPLPKGIICSRDGGHGNEYKYKVFDYRFDSFHLSKSKEEYAWTTIGECKKLLYGKTLTANPMIRILLDMAQRGDPRPKQRSKIGKYLCSKTHPSNRGYDEEFNNQIRELAPHWFETPREAFMKWIFAEAKAGRSKPTPTENHAQYERLRYWLREDRKFAARIRRLRPDWFESSTTQTKRELLELMKKLKERPPRRKHPLVEKLQGYIRPKDKSYDPDFVKQVKKVNPAWLE
jgi:hypothetical protein